MLFIYPKMDCKRVEGRSPPMKGRYYMFKNVMAANELSFANLNLQLFADEDYAEEVETNEAETEEVANLEGSEESTEETEETTENVEQQEDITQTQAFSRRLNAEREKIRQEAAAEAVDRHIAEEYKGQIWNGKPILTKADLDQANYESQLQNATNDPEEIQRLINEHPEVKAARLAQQKQADQQKMFEEWQELQSEYKEIKDFSQVGQDVYDMAARRGIPLLDAYNRVNVKNIKLKTEQDTIRNINKNATSSPDSVSSGGVVHKTKSVSEMTSEEFDSYREEVRKQKREY